MEIFTGCCSSRHSADKKKLKVPLFSPQVLIQDVLQEFLGIPAGFEDKDNEGNKGDEKSAMESKQSVTRWADTSKCLIF